MAVATPPPSDQTGGLLAIGIEQEGVRVCLLEPVAGTHRLVGWVGLQYDATMEPPLLIANACRRLGGRLGRVLWDEQRQTPLLDSEDPVRMPPVDQVALGLAARPRLRTWLAAISQRPGLAVLEAAISAAPAQVIGHTILTADLASAALAAALAQAKPEALVITGGYDDPAPAVQQPVVRLCQLFSEALLRLPVDQRPAIFYAGNHAAAPTALSLLAPVTTGSLVEILPNVLPAPGVVQQQTLAQVLTYYDWRLGERLPGYGRFSRWVTGPGQPSSLLGNFAQLTRLWLEQQGLAALRGLYCIPGCWLHVLADRQEAGVRLWFTQPNSEPPAPALPPISLISGPWPGQSGQLATHCWWDRDGLAPIVAAVGQVAPQALVETLVNDLLIRYD